MTLKERAEALRQASVFAELSQRALERVARVATAVEAPAGRVLIEAGEKGAGMFVLLEGEVTVDLRGGRRKAEIGPGGVVGELALLTPEGVRTARVRAKTPIRCVAIGRADFQGLLEHEPKLVRALLEIVAARLAERDST